MRTFVNFFIAFDTLEKVVLKKKPICNPKHVIKSEMLINFNLQHDVNTQEKMEVLIKKEQHKNLYLFFMQNLTEQLNIPS